MESIFSSGGVLDLHPNGANRLQIPKGWRPRKLFEPKIVGMNLQLRLHPPLLHLHMLLIMIQDLGK